MLPHVSAFYSPDSFLCYALLHTCVCHASDSVLCPCDFCPISFYPIAPGVRCSCVCVCVCVALGMPAMATLGKLPTTTRRRYFFSLKIPSRQKNCWRPRGHPPVVHTRHTHLQARHMFRNLCARHVRVRKPRHSFNTTPHAAIDGTHTRTHGVTHVHPSGRTHSAHEGPYICHTVWAEDNTAPANGAGVFY